MKKLFTLLLVLTSLTLAGCGASNEKVELETTKINFGEIGCVNGSVQKEFDVLCLQLKGNVGLVGNEAFTDDDFKIYSLKKKEGYMAVSISANVINKSELDDYLMKRGTDLGSIVYENIDGDRFDIMDITYYDSFKGVKAQKEVSVDFLTYAKSSNFNVGKIVFLENGLEFQTGITNDSAYQQTN